MPPKLCFFYWKGVDVIVNASSVEDIDAGAIGQRLSNGLARLSSPVLHRLRLREDENTEPVGTTYQKTDAAVEMKRINREQFWEQAKKEEELRKEEERKKALDARLRFEQERMEQERQEQEERERRYREREQQIEEHRRKQQTLEADEEEEEEEELSFGLELLYCLYETQEEDFVRQALSKLPEIVLERIRLTSMDLEVLSYCMKCSPEGQALRLVSCGLVEAKGKKKKKKKKNLLKRLKG